MTVAEAKEAIRKALDSASENYYCVGFRFENLNRKVGDVCGNSKHNPDREDVRDFPEYGTDEYDSLPELNGTCAYVPCALDPTFSGLSSGPNDNCDTAFFADHCYVIASDQDACNDDGDMYETLLCDPVVTAKIF
jgi:hypothetical protein